MKYAITLFTIALITASSYAQNSPFPGMKPIENVYINEGYGGDFHRKDCAELKKKTKEVKHEDTQILGYTPCNICLKDAKDYYYKPEDEKASKETK